MTEVAPVDAGPDGYLAARGRLTQGEAAAGPSRRSALTRLTDDWLAGLLTPPSAAHPTGVALVAVGGYGRGELGPCSDLDLLLLHDDSLHDRELARLADRVWYPVWDAGLALDHAVRTVAQARQAAADDLRVQLGLLDARHLAGDPTLTAELRGALLAQWRTQAPRRLPELRLLGEERARRHGELAFLLEPDLKQARGGLRDAVALRAVAASWLADAPRAGLEEARTVLLDTRDALHLVTGRSSDRLHLADQDQVAAHLGLPDADALLRRVYEAARTLAYATDVTWREVGRVLRARRTARPRLAARLAARRGGPPVAERVPLAEGVVEQDGEVGLARTTRPDRDPVLPLRAAACAARAGLPLAPPAVRRMATAWRPLPVPWPVEAREWFVTLLGAGPAAVPVWEALEAEGLVDRLLPGWAQVRCRPQRNAVHRWTVDRHLVETAVRASAFTRRVSRPDLLLVAALLHDIGKGWPGDHSVVGEVVARDLAVRMGFDTADVRVLATLVRHHLLLVETATRRDLTDPATIRAVTRAVGSVDTLALLHALTEADARATGPAAWSAWRGALVAELVERTTQALAGAACAPPPAAPPPTAEQERLAVEAWRLGGPALTLRAGGAATPHRAVADTGTGARETAGDEETAGSEEAVPEPSGWELLVAVPDRPGVLPALAGVLALHRLTVRTASLRALALLDGLLPPDAVAPEVVPSGGTRGSGPAGRPGEVLLRWRVAAEYGEPPSADRLRADLVRALEGTLDVAARLRERERAARRRPGVPVPPPRVTVVAAGSRRATVLEVRAPDAPGLLHRVGRALEDSPVAEVRVRSAYVSILGADAVDAFYLTGPDGAPLPGGTASALAEDVQRALGG